MTSSIGVVRPSALLSSASSCARAFPGSSAMWGPSSCGGRAGEAWSRSASANKRNCRIAPEAPFVARSRQSDMPNRGAAPMDLRLSDDELAFRDEVRGFIRDRLPEDIRDRLRLGHAATKSHIVRWQRILNEKGWAAYSWPEQYGGPGGAGWRG